MKFILLVVVCCISAAFCSVAMEEAPVTDPKLLDEGYSCQTDSYGIGLMKEDESINKYKRDICGEAECRNGRIMYMTCATVEVEKNCQLQSNLSKPYPQCCPQKFCH